MFMVFLSIPTNILSISLVTPSISGGVTPLLSRLERCYFELAK